jgi:rRNA maturation RNase YbeY
MRRVFVWQTLCHTTYMSSAFSITKTIRGQYPSYPYENMKDVIIGKKYELSLLFVGAKRAKDLNYAYRQKTYVPNVLSFPLNDTTGEIYICPQVAKKEAPKFGLTEKGYIAYLFIHGLLHLKGHDHSDKMDALEQKYLKQFDVK